LCRWQRTDGNFYGTTFSGGSSTDCYTEGCGTLFSLSVGLAPFVETLIPSGEVGANVSILGTGLKGATNVSFNGTSAEFTAKNSEIKAKLPEGSTTGTVTVTTASGSKLRTNVPFRVKPLIRSFAPRKGPVGKQVEITGVSLAQTTGVSFGGVAATQFEIDSNTEVTATVPTGATTGTITVTTSGGTATSKKSFTVTE
jgi:large repetitive protein